jgi:hypothetical protein
VDELGDHQISSKPGLVKAVGFLFLFLIVSQGPMVFSTENDGAYPH